MFRVILATCVLCSFSIGAPYVPLAVGIARAGLWNGIGAMIISWLFTIACGLLYLEAFLAVPEAKHIVSLSKKITGRFSSWSAFTIFLLYSYGSLIVCYGFMYQLVKDFFPEFNSLYPYALNLFIFIFALFTGFLIYKGQKATFAVVSIMFCFFLIFFIYSLIASEPTFSFPSAKPFSFSYYNIFLIGAAFNFLFYQALLPSIITFLNRDKKKVLIAIWTGITITLLLQLIWIWVTLRPAIYKHFLIVFESNSFTAENFNFLDFLPKFRLGFILIVLIIILQAYMCIALVLKDLFDDVRLHILENREKLQKVFLILLILIPPWIITLAFYDKWVTLRSIVGILTQYCIACFFPVVLVWTLRYQSEIPVVPVLPGGKKIFTLVICATVLEFFALWAFPQKIYW